MTDHRVVALPPLAGSPGLAQGAYGDNGNLELLAPDPIDGCWVFWFNADATDHQRGARPARWSGGLHLFAGHRVRAARITQARRGPNFLEALALTATGDLHRLYWTPDDGFVEAGVLARGVADCSAVDERHDALAIDVLLDDATARRLTGPTDDYPHVAWTAEPVAPPGQRWSTADAATGVRLDDTGRVLAGDTVIAAVGAHAVAAARTTLGGGRTDVVAAVDDTLVHVYGTGSRWSAPERIVSDVWVDAGARVHRRS